MLTRRERVLDSINFQSVDRLPYNIFLTGEMHRKMNVYTGKEDWLSGVDNHLCMMDITKPFTELSPGFVQDEYGIVWNRTGADKDIGIVDEYLLGDADDLSSLRLPPVDEPFIRSQMEKLIQKRGDRFSFPAIGFSLFERAWTLRGMENLLCDMVIQPDFVHELLDRITDRTLEILDIALEYDTDGVYFGDDWGQQKGLIMGPEYWHTFIEPRLRRLYGRVHASGKYVMQHSCGDIRPVMDTLYEIGLNVYNTFQPEIYTYDYAQKLRGRIAIWGGVSTQVDLPRKTPDEIRAVTRSMFEAFDYTGLIAAPTHAVPPDVPPENILAMVEEMAKGYR